MGVLKMDKAVTQRLQLFILMENDGYLSMSMMMDLLSGLAQSTGTKDQDVIDEFTRLREATDFEVSDLYFYFETKKG